MKFECLQAATSSTTPTSSECESKRKRLVTRSLSVSVYANAICEIMCFVQQNKVYTLHKGLEICFLPEEL